MKFISNLFKRKKKKESRFIQRHLTPHCRGYKTAYAVRTREHLKDMPHGIRWVGVNVFVEDENKVYRLANGIGDGDWEQTDLTEKFGYVLEKEEQWGKAPVNIMEK